MSQKNPSMISSTESNSEKIQWVEDLAVAGFALVPLLRDSKKTVTHDWVDMKPDPLLNGADIEGNYGVVLRDDILVVDVDVKKFEPGDDPFIRLKLDLGMNASDHFDTYTVRSRQYPGKPDGLHIYFKKPPGFNLKTHSERYGKGIEVKSYGTYLVGPGSIHPDTGQPYIVLRGAPDNLASVPFFILEEFDRTSRKGVKGTGEYKDDEATRTLFINFLASREPAIQGCEGDNWTFKTAAAGRDYGLPPEATFDLMKTLWNPRCVPMWSDKGLWSKVNSAYKSSRDEIGNRHPSAAFDLVEPPPVAEDINASKLAEAVQKKIDRKEADRKANIVWQPHPRSKPSEDPYAEPELKASLINVINFFQRPHHGTYQSPFYRSVRYNMFTRDIEFTRSMPWHTKDDKPKKWTTVETIMFRTWLSLVREFEVSDELALAGVISAAQIYKYHPLIEYFRSLEWDRVKRIESLFPYYCGSDDNAYTREVGRCLMQAIVARVMQPGVKYDQLVILEGKQGTGKSTFCDILGGDYYADLHIDPKSKDTQTDIMGKSVVELSELTFNKKSDVESTKAFLSRRVARVRLPYARLSEDIPLQCVFIGTTNEVDPYLRDQTGNRRQWPVLTRKIRIEELKRDRDQLYAEAFYNWTVGETHHMTDPETVLMAEREQKKRTETDSWVDLVERWLKRELEQGKVYRSLSCIDVAEDVLNIAARQVDRYTTQRISATMNALGWESGRAREDGTMRRVYKNPNYTREAQALRERGVT